MTGFILFIKMRKIITHIVFALFFSTTFYSQPILNRFTVDYYQINNLIIEGNSNVSSFKLTYDDNLISPVYQTNETIADEVVISLPANNIKGKNRLMTEDFHEMINSDSFPYIKIEITNKDLSLPSETDKNINLRIGLYISGSKNYYYTPVTITTDKNTTSVKGTINFRLTDFNITPPEKFLGLIKVKNEVIVSFDLLFKPLEN